MLFSKNFRPIVLIAAVAFMFLASTSVEAAPAIPDELACTICDEPPECVDFCQPGYFCSTSYCTCSAICRKLPIN
ncbi:hypothetical protein BGX33_012276 [Mortierella sp. NVP41]|nr:hypothetical protein BGX33_012276 [Mortierella sp. NVP41]